MSMTATPSTLQELLAHQDWARRLARRLVGSDDADDLVQDAWVAALVARPAARDGLRPWLATVLGRSAWHRRRDQQRRTAREQASGDLVQAAIPPPEALVAQVEMQRLLAELVLALDPAVRDVILLRFHQGLTSPEIARKLAVPEGTVRWRIKTGLDELRARLDQRHGGRRDQWLGLLVPMAGGERARTARPAAGAALMAGAVLVGGVLVAALVRTPTAGSAATTESGVITADRESGASHQGPGSGGSNAPASRPPQLAALATIEACQRQLAGVREQLAASEVEFVETAGVNAPAALFDHGAPNAAAEAVLAPEVRRVLGDPAAARLAGHTLTCRTLICRLSVLVPADAPAIDWDRLVQLDPDLSPRMRSGGPRGRGPALRDAVSGGSYHEEWRYFRLWNPAAQAFSRADLIAAGAAPGVPPAVFGPLPASLEACRAELGTADQRLATMTAVIQRHMLPERRWQRGQPNRALTTEIDALVRSILALPPGSAAVTVECREDVCRVDFARDHFPGPNDWKQLFTPGWRRRARGQMSVGGWRAHFTIGPATGSPSSIAR